MSEVDRAVRSQFSVVIIVIELALEEYSIFADLATASGLFSQLQ